MRVSRADAALLYAVLTLRKAVDGMHFTSQLFLDYGYWIVFGWVLVEQLGVPLPSSPILLTAGALTATHHMRIVGIVLAVMAGSAISDFVWFRLEGGTAVR